MMGFSMVAILMFVDNTVDYSIPIPRKLLAMGWWPNLVCQAIVLRTKRLENLTGIHIFIFHQSCYRFLR